MVQLIIEIPHIKQSVVMKAEEWAGAKSFVELVKHVRKINFDTHAPNEYIAKTRFSFKSGSFNTWRPEGDHPFPIADHKIEPAEHNFVWRRDGRHWCYGNGSIAGAYPFTMAFMENPDEFAGINVLKSLDHSIGYDTYN